MTSVEDATAILKRFRENNYFINDKAISRSHEERVIARHVYFQRYEDWYQQNREQYECFIRWFHV